MNKTKTNDSPASQVLDRDAGLQAAAEAFVEGDRSDESLKLLRDRALAFADALARLRGREVTAVKLDLDDLESKARAATGGEWAADRVSGMPADDDPIMAVVISDELGDDGRAQQIADCYDNTRCSDKQNEANAAHIASASPPVVLALIARIRELEIGSAQRLAMAEDFNAQRVEAGRRIVPLERIAKAATAFVEAQGKIATRELLERPDFATSEWEDLVLAEGAGR